MKIVWTLLLGMLIFQSLFVTFGYLDAFNIDNKELIGMDNVSSTTEGYEDLSLGNSGNLFDFLAANTSWFIGLGTTILVIAMIGLKNYVGAALAVYLGFVSWLYVQTAGILIKMNNIGGGSAVGVAFIGLFGVVLTVLVIKSVIDMLAPGGVD